MTTSPAGFAAAHGSAPFGRDPAAESGTRRGLVGVGGLLDTVQLGDNAQIMESLPDECVDLVVTSPPYDDMRKYGQHSWDFERVAAQLKRLLKPGGVIVWVVSDKTEDGSETGTSMMQALHLKNACGLLLWDTMVFEKPMCRYGDTASRYAGVWEYMFVLSKGRPKAINLIRDVPNKSFGAVYALNFDRRKDERGNLSKERKTKHVVAEFGYRRNIWKYHVGSSQSKNEQCGGQHPAIFPEALAKDHIVSWSNPGDLVFDPFAGSGTTLKAAKDLNRHWLGIEINPEYVDICRARLAQDVLPLMGGGGAEHGENAHERHEGKVPNDELKNAGH